MRRHLALSLALLFIAFGVPSNAQTAAEPTSAAPAPAAAAAAAAEADASGVLMYDMPLSFSVNCTLVPAAGESYVWIKNDTLVENIPELRGRYQVDNDGATLRVERPTNEDDFGNYTCSVGGTNQTYDVRARPHFKLPHNTNVVEKQPLKLSCKVTGKPYQEVTWLFLNETHNYTDALQTLGARASVQSNAQGVPGAELLLSEALRSDAGVYVCLVDDAGPLGRNATTTLRVKDQYAALWPFLGICAEVFVLCAIILVYEKRRTKPELDDSDTDNHDQKKS